MDITIKNLAPLSGTVLDEVERAIVGKRALLENVMAAVLADGHVLLEDNPGLGKTLLAKSFATALGLDFKRIQFTPDLLPTDITGASIYLPDDGNFKFVPGPVFANIVLADEINRSSPRTQSALLEAMGEGYVTFDGTTRSLPRPFFVIATRNHAETHGTRGVPRHHFGE